MNEALLDKAKDQQVSSQHQRQLASQPLLAACLALPAGLDRGDSHPLSPESRPPLQHQSHLQDGQRDPGGKADKAGTTKKGGT